MKHLLFKTLWLLSSLVAFLSSAFTHADDRGNSRHALSGMQYAQASEISKSQAAAIAKARHGGKVVKVTRAGDSYRVRLLLDEGKVKTVTVSAKAAKG